MAMRLPFWSRYFVTLTLLGSGVLLSASIDSGSGRYGFEPSAYSAVDPAHFDVGYFGGRLRIDGHSASVDHEHAVAQLVDARFGISEIDLRPVVVANSDWTASTLALVEAIAGSDSANATLTANRLKLRAVVSDEAAWAIRLSALESALPEGVRLAVDVVEVADRGERVCRSAYRDLADQPVSFDRASTTLRTASYGVLDRHVEFAFDCADYTIAVTGHTDDRGNETWNRQLSLARATAVTDYLASRGVPTERLIAVGAGSSRPVADNETAWGRAKNRRIEFELRD